MNETIETVEETTTTTEWEVSPVSIRIENDLVLGRLWNPSARRPQPVILNVRAIDAFYPNPVHEGVTTVCLRSGKVIDLGNTFVDLAASLHLTEQPEWATVASEFSLAE